MNLYYVEVAFVGGDVRENNSSRSAGEIAVRPIRERF